MGLAHSPRIVTDGIVLAYDETNVKSADTSELILSRSATVASSTQRNFAQDTLLETTYASVAQYDNTAPAPGSGFSFSAWIRRTGATSGSWDPIVLIDSGGPRYRMLWFGWYFNTTDRIHCSMPYYSATDTSSYWSVDPTWANAGLTLVTNQWYNFSASYDNTTRSLNTYINANLAASGTRPGAGDLNNPNSAVVRLYGCDGVSNSNSQITAFTMYNKALTQEEITQNFNALRGRYGI